MCYNKSWGRARQPRLSRALRALLLAALITLPGGLILETVGVTRCYAAPPPFMKVKTKAINLRIAVKAGQEPVSLPTSFDYDHEAIFTPNPECSKTLGLGSMPVTITRSKGYITDVTSPASGTYHSGAVAYSGVVLDPLGYNPATSEAIVTGHIDWGTEPPTPSLWHGELYGFTTAVTECVISAANVTGEYKGIQLGLFLDDGITGGAEVYSATDEDLVALSVNGQTVLTSRTRSSTGDGGFVAISPAGLSIGAPASGTASVTWSIMDSVQGSDVTYWALLALGDFAASGNWAALPWSVTLNATHTSP